MNRSFRMFIDVQDSDLSWKRAIIIDQDPNDMDDGGPRTSILSALSAFQTIGQVPLRLVFREDPVETWGSRRIYFTFNSRITLQRALGGVHMVGRAVKEPKQLERFSLVESAEPLVLKWRLNRTCRRIKDSDQEVESSFGGPKGWKVTVKNEDSSEERITLDSSQKWQSLLFELLEYSRSEYVKYILQQSGVYFNNLREAEGRNRTLRGISQAWSSVSDLLKECGSVCEELRDYSTPLSDLLFPSNKQ